MSTHQPRTPATTGRWFDGPGRSRCPGWGHRDYTDHAAALGDDLVLLPLPDLGHGNHGSQGSWAWRSAAPAHPNNGYRRDAPSDEPAS